jgi:hypothetical protein
MPIPELDSGLQMRETFRAENRSQRACPDAFADKPPGDTELRHTR